jgi:hypothetical protein
MAVPLCYMCPAVRCAHLGLVWQSTAANHATPAASVTLPTPALHISCFLPLQSALLMLVCSNAAVHPSAVRSTDSSGATVLHLQCAVTICPVTPCFCCLLYCPCSALRFPGSCVAVLLYIVVAVTQPTLLVSLCYICSVLRFPGWCMAYWCCFTLPSDTMLSDPPLQCAAFPRLVCGIVPCTSNRSSAYQHHALVAFCAATAVRCASQARVWQCC